jgi:hypothetical protein
MHLGTASFVKTPFGGVYLSAGNVIDPGALTMRSNTIGRTWLTPRLTSAQVRASSTDRRATAHWCLEAAKVEPSVGQIGGKHRGPCSDVGE